MGDLIFVAKCFLLTLLVVVALQIRVGGRTLESQTVNWIHRSNIVHELQDVAEGAVKVGKKSSKEVGELFKDGTDEMIERATR